jgi:hypothetical protein
VQLVPQDEPSVGPGAKSAFRIATESARVAVARKQENKSKQPRSDFDGMSGLSDFKIWTAGLPVERMPKTNMPGLRGNGASSVPKRTTAQVADNTKLMVHGRFLQESYYMDCTSDRKTSSVMLTRRWQDDPSTILSVIRASVKRAAANLPPTEIQTFTPFTFKPRY